jgi:plastocyanin
VIVLAQNQSRRKVAVLITFFLMAFIVTGLTPALVPTAFAKGTIVSIKEYSFSPGTITVVIGVNNTVTWMNNGTVDHTVTANDNSFDAGHVSPGSSFTQTFTVAGTYGYHCNIHTSMKGTVVVIGPGSSSSSATTTTSSGGIPEFPFQAVGIALVTVLVVASYFLARQTLRPRVPHA